MSTKRHDGHDDTMAHDRRSLRRLAAGRASRATELKFIKRPTRRPVVFRYETTCASMQLLQLADGLELDQHRLRRQSGRFAAREFATPCSERRRLLALELDSARLEFQAERTARRCVSLKPGPSSRCTSMPHATALVTIASSVGRERCHRQHESLLRCLRDLRAHRVHRAHRAHRETRVSVCLDSRSAASSAARSTS